MELMLAVRRAVDSANTDFPTEGACLISLFGLAICAGRGYSAGVDLARSEVTPDAAETFLS